MKKLSLLLVVLIVLSTFASCTAVNNVFGKNYKITYDANEMVKSTTDYVDMDELPTIPEAPVVEGYVFAGWFFDKEYTSRYFFDYPLNQNTTLYAKFYDTKLGEYIVISNVDQLMAIKDAPEAKYLLARDINCNGETLTPITEFLGEIEGNGYRIFNFSINEDTADAAFIRTNAGVIKNLTFDDFTYDVLISSAGEKHYGIVCGTNNGTLENCHTSDGVIRVDISSYNVSSTMHLGGLAGHNNGTINNCSNSAMINVSSSSSGYSSWGNVHAGYITGRVAGVCGYVAAEGKVVDCGNYANIILKVISNSYGYSYFGISGVVATNYGKIDRVENLANLDIELGNNYYVSHNVGGVVGDNYGTVSNGSTQGNININSNVNNADASHVGGFAGYNNGKLYNCYSVTNLKDTSLGFKGIGGFVGYNELKSNTESLVNKCFAMGSIELAITPTNVGYFAGLSTGTIKDAYYADTLVINKVVKAEADGAETTEAVTVTNTLGEAMSEGELLSINFLENKLYFDRMVWFLVEGKLPELR